MPNLAWAMPNAERAMKSKYRPKRMRKMMQVIFGRFLNCLLHYSQNCRSVAFGLCRADARNFEEFFLSVRKICRDVVENLVAEDVECRNIEFMRLFEPPGF